MKKLHKIILIAALAIVLLPVFFNGGNHIIVKQLSLVLIPILGLLTCKFQNKKAYILLGLFLLLLIITSLFSASPGNSFEVAREYIALGLLFVIISSLNINDKHKDIAIKTLVITGAIVSVIGLYFLSTGSYHRLTSTFYWPNPAASYLIIIIPLAFYWLMKDSRKLIPALLTIIVLSSLILTFSRGAWLALLAAAILFVLFTKKKIKLSALKVPAIAIIISILLATGFSYTKLLFNNFIQADAHSSSFEARLNYYQGGINIFQNNIWSGSGLNSFSNLYPQYQSNPLHFSQYIHNWYLEIMAEAGIFSLLTFILLLIFVFKFTDKKDGANLAIILGLAAFLLHNLIDIGSHFFANQLLFWSLLGLIISVKGKRLKFLTNTALLSLITILLLISLLSLGRVIYLNDSLKSLTKGDITKAITTQEKTTAISWLPEDNYYLANLYIQTNQLDKAFTQIQKTISANPYEALHYELAGNLAVINKNLDAAQNYFSQAQYLSPLSLRHNLNLMLILSEQERWQSVNEVGTNILKHYNQDIVFQQEFTIIANQKTSGHNQNYWLNIQQLLDLSQEKITNKHLEKSQ